MEGGRQFYVKAGQRETLLRRALLVLVGTAFLLQSYATQTHVHHLPAISAAAGTLAPNDSDLAGKAESTTSLKFVKADRRAPPADKVPAGDDPAKCPLCQAIGYAGQFVWPDVTVFVLPQQAASIVQTLAAIASKPPADSYNWQGRAPPRA